MKCLCSGEQFVGADEMVPPSESHSHDSKDIYSVSASGGSLSAGQVDRKKPDTGNIEEAESSLRESGYLNYEVGLDLVVYYMM